MFTFEQWLIFGLGACAGCGLAALIMYVAARIAEAGYLADVESHRHAALEAHRARRAAEGECFALREENEHLFMMLHGDEADPAEAWKAGACFPEPLPRDTRLPEDAP